MYLLGIDVSLCGGNSFITGFRGDTKKWIGNTEQNKNTQRKSCSLKNCTALWMWGISLGQREGDVISTFVSLGYDVVVVQFGGCLQNTLIWKTRALFSALSLSLSLIHALALNVFSLLFCVENTHDILLGAIQIHTQQGSFQHFVLLQWEKSSFRISEQNSWLDVIVIQLSLFPWCLRRPLETYANGLYVIRVCLCANFDMFILY